MARRLLVALLLAAGHAAVVRVANFEQLRDAIQDGADIVVTAPVIKFTSAINLPKKVSVTISSPDGAVLDGSNLVRLFYVFQSKLTLRNLVLRRGKIDYGGAIYFDFGQGNISSCTFEEHHTTRPGAAIFAKGSTLQLYDVAFRDNEVEGRRRGRGGSAAYILGNTDATVYMRSADPSQDFYFNHDFTGRVTFFCAMPALSGDRSGGIVADASKEDCPLPVLSTTAPPKTTEEPTEAPGDGGQPQPIAVAETTARPAVPPRTAPPTAADALPSGTQAAGTPFWVWLLAAAVVALCCVAAALAVRFFTDSEPESSRPKAKSKRPPTRRQPAVALSGALTAVPASTQLTAAQPAMAFASTSTSVAAPLLVPSQPAAQVLALSPTAAVRSPVAMQRYPFVSVSGQPVASMAQAGQPVATVMVPIATSRVVASRVQEQGPVVLAHVSGQGAAAAPVRG